MRIPIWNTKNGGTPMPRHPDKLAEDTCGVIDCFETRLGFTEVQSVFERRGAPSLFIRICTKHSNALRTKPRAEA